MKTKSTSKVVLVRHGESVWNQKNLFCAWYDADLSSKGLEEAVAIGKAIKQAGFQFDLAYTSVLKRANITMKIILETIGQENVPINTTWRLNERHYGNLTGINKSELAAKYGEEQVQLWRRSYDISPPPIEKSNPYYQIILDNPIYSKGPPKDQFPLCESLQQTIERTIPYWNEEIKPQLLAGKTILIVAHSNSLRGVVKYLDHLNDKQIMGLNIPTGIPFVYEFDENLKPVVSLKFLGDEKVVKKAMAEVAAQGKIKK